MKSIKMNAGNIEFTTISGIDEFWQRIVNSLKIYSNECFYDENLGLDIRMINEQEISEYKLEHICGKLKEWYRKEIEDVNYEILSEKERILKAKIKINHKKYQYIESEVIISG